MSVIMNPITATDQILQQLDSITRVWPALEEAALLRKVILPISVNAGHALTRQISMTKEEACIRMEAGLPLLHGVEPELDIEAVRSLMIQLSKAAEGISPESASRIRHSLENESLDIASLLSGIISGEEDAAVVAAQSAQLDPGLLPVLAGQALRPSFHECRRQLASVAEGISWNEGYCFICGSYAVFGELRSGVQEKHLRCWRCGADWRFHRLQCSYCANDDYRKLRFIYSGGQPERIHAEICDECGMYLKIIVSASSTPYEMMEVEDLATLNVDYELKERGYARPSSFHRKGV
ncbi:MAG TPA: formate dehydrogenase accessory protein FdhE [Dissulfurispiraceae bacterium]|nr:formate dehydrogenase accessory protein FdhE [Dissulfurispiraceae bacterium]